MIEKLTIDNVECVKRLGLKLNANFDNLYDYSSLNEGVNSTYVLIVDKNIIGFIHIQQLIDEVDIIDVVIDEEYRRKGYGQRLVEFVIHNNLGKRIILEVSVNNKAAIGLYNKLGFREINTRKGYYNGVDAVVMERKWF